MLIVTGTPRSGTSLTMQTLKLLGYPVTGGKFNNENRSVKDMNRKGYYELLIDKVTGGVKRKDFKNKAVKVMGKPLFDTDPREADKLIVCKRNEPECLDSLKRWLDKNTFLDLNISAKEVYDYNVYVTINFMESFDKDFLVVCYEDYIFHPEDTVRDIADYIGKDFNKNAVDNIERRF